MLRSIGALMVARTALFSPLNIGGLKLWLKADSLALADNDPVGTWSDQSGSGNDVTAALAARPTYKTNILNGLPTVRFDGTANVLEAAFTITYGTVFAVCNFNSAGNFPAYNGLVVSNNGAAAVDNHVQGTGASTNLYNGAVNTIYINKVATVDFSPLLTVKVITVIDNTPDSRTNIDIGNDPDTGGRFWNGDAFEILVYDTALADTDRGRVENYLNSKWALF